MANIYCPMCANGMQRNDSDNMELEPTAYVCFHYICPSCNATITERYDFTEISAEREREYS